MSIERKRGSRRRKEGFVNQNKASKTIRIFLKHPNMSVRKEKWLKKLDFVKTYCIKCINFIHKRIRILLTLIEIQEVAVV